MLGLQLGQRTAQRSGFAGAGNVPSKSTASGKCPCHAAAGGPAAAPVFVHIYEWAWFVSFFLAGAIYLAGMKLQQTKK